MFLFTNAEDLLALLPGFADEAHRLYVTLFAGQDPSEYALSLLNYFTSPLQHTRCQIQKPICASHGGLVQRVQVGWAVEVRFYASIRSTAHWQGLGFGQLVERCVEQKRGCERINFATGAHAHERCVADYCAFTYRSLAGFERTFISNLNCPHRAFFVLRSFYSIPARVRSLKSKIPHDVPV